MDCVDRFDVQKEGDSRMGTARQIIVPQPYFFCNGRINGLLVSLDLDDDDDVDNPYIQVWRITNSDTYSLVDQYQLQESDISRRSDYYLANVTLNGDNRIEFQSNDVIGYYNPLKPRYRVWDDENTRGYTIYNVLTHFPLSVFKIRQTGTSISVFQNMRPLIQVLYGNRH